MPMYTKALNLRVRCVATASFKSYLVFLQYKKGNKKLTSITVNEINAPSTESALDVKLNITPEGLQHLQQ